MLPRKIFAKIKQLRLGESRSLISAFSYGTASILTQGIMMIYLIIVAQWLGAEQYGYIAAAHAATALSAFLFSWGFNEWLMKAGSTIPDVEALGGSVVKLKGLLGMAWGVGLFIVLRLIRPDVYLSSVVILSIVEVWFDSTFGTLLALLVLKEQVKRAAVLLTLSRLFRLLTVVGLILLGSRSVIWVLFLRLITTLLFFILAWIFTMPKLFGDNLIQPRALFRSSSAFNISELLNLIFLHADVNILSWLGADLELIANYSIVISLINAAITLPSGIYNVILPNMVKAYQHIKANFHRYMQWLYAGFFIMGVALWVGAAYLSKPVVTLLFGETYLPSIDLLIWLSPLLFLRTINQANIAYLVTVGCQTRRLLPQLVAVVAKIAAGFMAVANLQALGIIIVTISTEGILFCGYVIQIVRHYLNPLKMECHEYFDDHV